MAVDRALYERLRKRRLMFYFAAGINLVLGLWALSVGPGNVAGDTLWLIVFIFLAFAGVNIYMARLLKKQWDRHLREHGGEISDEVTK